MRLALAVLAATVLFGSPPSQETEPAGVELVPLRYRTSAEVLPALLPVVEGRGAIVGAGEQLLIRGTPQARRDVKALVSVLDVPSRPVRIVVRQVFTRRESGAVPAAAVVAGRVPINRLGMRFPGFSSGDQDALGREASETPIRIRPDALSGKQPAAAEDDFAAAIVDDWLYATLGRSVFVVPHLLEGDHVTVDIVTRPLPPAEPPRELRTSVEGTLGQWIDISPALEDHAWRRSGPENERPRETRTDSVVLVRLERIGD
jgi:hypothetical protein